MCYSQLLKICLKYELTTCFSTQEPLFGGLNTLICVMTFNKDVCMCNDNKRIVCMKQADDVLFCNTY